MPPKGKTIWVCVVCGYVHEGEAPPDECPQCGAGPDLFERSEIPPKQSASVTPDASPPSADPLKEYLAPWRRDADEAEAKFAAIQHLATTGQSEIAAMRTRRSFPGWETILFKGGQLDRPPLNEDEPVDTRTIIGKTAKQPMTLAVPFYVSHMSFGALSREAKIALARGSKRAGTAIASGEGGMLPEERAEAGLYIYEIGTAAYTYNEDAIRQADAVEIKIGQAAKPGMGGHLPREKISEEIARIRNIPRDQDAISPGRPYYLKTPGDLAVMVSTLRTLNGGKPVGIKIAAGHVEADLACALDAGPDFITIDCRGGGTGAAPVFVKDNVCLPPIFALHRARRCLDAAGSQATLCVTGGFRDASDIAKALAMGADAVALATASLIAIGCQQYRVCHTGKCPVGITTQDPALRERLDPELSAQRLVHFYHGTSEELITFARINGRASIHDLDRSDLVTLSHEVAQYAGIEHA
jgi:glutamate synthase domain-containing protein 2/rubredoxin